MPFCARRMPGSAAATWSFPSLAKRARASSSTAASSTPGWMATALRGDGSCTTASRGVKKRHFFAIYIYNASIYQDRLGTNIGKTQKKSDVSSGGWLRTESGVWREPTPHNNPHNLFPQRLAAHDDPTVRRLFCLWSPSMCEFAASSFDPAYRSSVVRPTFKGSPDPALRLFDERQEA
jgi:hypothetical protein